MLALLAACVSGTAYAGAPEAEKLLWSGRLNEALLAARDEADRTPADLDAQELYLDILLSLGQARQAERRARSVQSARPTDPDAHYLVGRAVVEAAEAQRAYESALRLDPDHARAHMGMGALHAARGRPEAAAAAYERAVRRDPALSEAWMGWVRALVELGDLEGARARSREGLVHCAGEGGLYLGLARLEPGDAIAILETGVTGAPDDPRVLEDLAERRLDRGEWVDARRAAGAALSIDPRRLDAGRTLLVAAEVGSGVLDTAGWQELRAARVADARGDKTGWGKLVRAYPRSVLARLGRARARQDTDPAAALADLEFAAKLAPDLPEVQAPLGMALLQAGRHEQARTWLGKARSARPWDASLGVALAAAHTAAGEPQAAALELEPLVASHPWDVPVLLAWAQALVDTGQADRAYRETRAAVRRLPDPRLGAAVVLTAAAAGAYAEAADLLDELAEKGDSDELRDLASKLRKRARGEGSPALEPVPQ